MPAEFGVGEEAFDDLILRHALELPQPIRAALTHINRSPVTTHPQSAGDGGNTKLSR